jgi:uncharacterized Fe-S center protein
MSSKTPITILLATILILSFIAGCSAVDNSSVEESQENPLPGRIENGASQVLMATDISPNGLKAVYEALNRPAKGKVAIKIHMGEPGNTNYLSPELIHNLTLSVNGTFVDSNTAYGGSRANTATHLQVAKDHGFTYAPVDILDADGEINLEIAGGNRLDKAIIGSHYRNYDFIISIAHFKGHLLAGFGGTFKNLAVGMASVNGKKPSITNPVVPCSLRRMMLFWKR